jgi:hypothetical protein
VKLGSEALDRLLEGVDLDGDDDVRALTFIRGLALGALVGAAIAGSTIWQRRHARSTRASAAIEPPASTVPEADPPR